MTTRETNREIVIRAVNTFDELDACVQLQQSVWQFQTLDVIPRRMFVVARAVGGQIFGAFDGDKLAGYALAIPGVRNGHAYLHSHMLAVLPEYRNRGLGKLLKLAQRDDALERGIDLIEWTFDPLQTRNAYFNIEKLGAVVRRYTPNFYGTSSSPLHGALPTDRLHAEWWVRSKRVDQLLSGHKLPELRADVTIKVTNTGSESGNRAQPGNATGLKCLLGVREEFAAAFATGLTVLRFELSGENDGSYRLGKWDEPWPY